MFRSLRQRLEGIGEGYGGSQPLRGYLTTLTVYASVVSGLTAVAAATGRRGPSRPAAGDVILIAVATHKLSRLLAKEAVTSPLRAAVTRFEGAAGSSEVNEVPRATGSGHAAAELISCPFCLGVWVSTGFCAGLVFLPRLTRLVATGLTAVAGSDFLQLAYDAAKAATGNAGRHGG
ncbi:DUF1360 domain-containing protein [Rugosimonospora acidiphila]|uniref:DUF1360 domain-containing protein n=1 Tax=Rugosimonospora acidiphila TaxID=556531 RepID=A0ABP9RQ02_9ACTN